MRITRLYKRFKNQYRIHKHNLPLRAILRISWTQSKRGEKKMSEKARSWTVHSTSNPHAVYAVARDIFGDFSCTCPDFVFRGHQCKHIKRAKMKLACEKQKNKLSGVSEE